MRSMRAVGWMSTLAFTGGTSGIHEHELHHRFARQLVVDARAAVDLGRLGTNREGLALEPELVARDDGAAELDAVDGEQHRDLRRVEEASQEKHARELRQ